MRQHQHRTGASAALLVAMLLALTGLGLPAVAQPAEPVLRQGPGWSVTQAPAGFRVTVAPPGGVPYRSAYPQITADGVDLGVAVRAPDARSADVVTADPRVLVATEVRLTWPGDRLRETGPTAHEPWATREAGPLLPVDPGTPGRYGVEEREYDLGDTAYVPPALGQAVELRGLVYAPTGAPGPRPVIVFLHGMHQPLLRRADRGVAGGAVAVRGGSAPGAQPHRLRPAGEAAGQPRLRGPVAERQRAQRLRRHAGGRRPPGPGRVGAHAPRPVAAVVHGGRRAVRQPVRGGP